jgi:hypothetical protein
MLHVNFRCFTEHFLDFKGQKKESALLPESVTPEPATAWLVPMASTIAVHRPLGAAALLPRCMGRLS